MERKIMSKIDFYRFKKSYMDFLIFKSVSPCNSLYLDVNGVMYKTKRLDREYFNRGWGNIKMCVIRWAFKEWENMNKTPMENLLRFIFFNHFKNRVYNNGGMVESCRNISERYKKILITDFRNRE